jgi:hypothetical protein
MRTKLLWAAAICVVLLAGVAFALLRPDGPDETPATGTAPPTAASAGNAESVEPVEPSEKVTPMAGLQPSTVLAAWSARWKKAPTTEGKYQVISVAYPEPKAELRMVISATSVGCALVGKRVPATGKTLAKLAGDCLQPALRAGELTELRAWLTGEDYRQWRRKSWWEMSQP